MKLSKIRLECTISLVVIEPEYHIFLKERVQDRVNTIH